MNYCMVASMLLFLMVYCNINTFALIFILRTTTGGLDEIKINPKKACMPNHQIIVRISKTV